MPVASMTVLPAVPVVRLARAVPAPTAASNWVVPPVFTVRLEAPFTVFLSQIFPDPVERSAVSVAFMVNWSLYVWAPLVLTEPPLIAVEPAASVLMLVSAVLPPTAPPKVVRPLSVTVRADGPFSVPLKLTATPLMAVFAAPKVTLSP